MRKFGGWLRLWVVISLLAMIPAGMLSHYRHGRLIQRMSASEFLHRSENTELLAEALTALLFWIVFCVSLLVFGCTIRWVYRGFRDISLKDHE